LNVDFEPILTAIRYSYPIRPVLTYVLSAPKRRSCAKFHQDSFKTERLHNFDCEKNYLWEWYCKKYIFYWI